MNMKKDDSFSRLSSSIECMRFPLMLSIIFIHAYIAVPLYGHQTYYTIIYPFALWFGETGVPGFFFISGLWFFYSKKKYSLKIKDRFHTLLIPYIVWNSILLFIFIIAFIFGYHREILLGKGIADYELIDYIRAYWDRGDFDGGNFKPIYPPMWYLRNLMLLCLLSPLIKAIIQKTGLSLPIITGTIWCFTYNEGLIFESISAFSLGAYFPIKKVNLVDVLNKYKHIATIIFFTLAMGDYITHRFYPFSYCLQVHRLAVFANILYMPVIGSFLLKYHLYNKSLSQMTFFIYCIHLPFVTIIRKPILGHPEFSDHTHIFLYFISVLFITLICISIFKLLEKCFPSIMNIITGNRRKQIKRDYNEK